MYSCISYVIKINISLKLQRIHYKLVILFLENQRKCLQKLLGTEISLQCLVINLISIKSVSFSAKSINRRLEDIEHEVQMYNSSEKDIIPGMK